MKTRDLSAFNARCRAAFPDFVEARFNEAVGRFEVVTLSAANMPVSQFFGWFRNPITGEKIEPDYVTGLVPYRDLNDDAQNEVFANLEKSFIGNAHDGAGTNANDIARRRAHNEALRRTRLRQRAETIANVIKEVDLNRPWVKFHPWAKDPHSKRLRRAHLSQ